MSITRPLIAGAHAELHSPEYRGMDCEPLARTLSGELWLLGADLLLAGDTSDRTLAAVLDAQETHHFHPHGPRTTDLINAMDAHLAELYGAPERGISAPLTDLEIIGSYLTARAEQYGVPLQKALQPSSPTHCPPDETVTLPSEVPIRDLRPPDPNATLDPLFDESVNDFEAGAVAALMWVQARHRHPVTNLLPVLTFAAAALSVAEDLCREDRRPTTVIRAALNVLRGEVRALGIRIPGLIPLQPIRREHRAFVRRTLHQQVRRCMNAAAGHRNAWQANKENRLWDVLDTLERDLADLEGTNGNVSIITRHILALTTLDALIVTDRAPGAPLPPITEIAATLSGIDPLWGWATFQNHERIRRQLTEQLELAREASIAALRVAAAAPECADRAQDVSHLAVSEVLALCRTNRLPIPADMQDVLLLGRRPAFQAPLTDHGREELNIKAVAVLDDLIRIAEVLPEKTAEPVRVNPAEETLDAPATCVDPAGADTNAKAETDMRPVRPAHVQAVREHLAGRSITLLGGVMKPSHHAALERELGCTVDWIPSAEYDHGHHAAARVTPETAVVVLAVRWMAHAHNALRDIARERNVPYVMHPGGLSPSSVAWQILQQVGKRL